MRLRSTFALVLVLATVPAVAGARPGTLDPSFGKGGVVTAGPSGPGSQSWALAVAVQSDGKIIAGGETLVRYRSDGSLDPTYGTGGERPMAIPVGFPIFMFMLPGDVLLVGSTVESGGYLARHLSDGSLDPGFGTGGIATVSWLTDVTLQPDGKILLAGGGVGIVRLLPDGTPDADFGSGGVAIAPVPYLGDQVAVQADGTIVTAGTIGSRDDRAFVLMSFDADGHFDPSFGTDGVVIFDPVAEATDTLVHLLAQPDGVVAVGQSIDQQYWFTLTRFVHGVVDQNFGVLGVTRVNFRHQGAGINEWPYAATIDGDGNILIAGRVRAYGSRPIAMMRFERNGTLDGSFGTGGGTLEFLPAGETTSYGVAIGPADEIVVAGALYDPSYESPGSAPQRFAVSRFEGGGADLPRCPHTREFGCRDLPPGGKARLMIKNAIAGKGDALQFQWSGPVTSDLGDPLTTDAYALCLYKNSEVVWPPLRYTAAAPAGGLCGSKPCWKASGTAFKYANSATTPMGIASLLLKKTPGTTKLALKGRGPNLGGAMLTPIGGVFLSPFEFPIVVQLHASNGTCWSVEFWEPAARNDATQVTVLTTR